jgi:hypothetical protein
MGLRRLWPLGRSRLAGRKLTRPRAAQRELGSANSIAEVMAWRLDGYLANNLPPQGDRPYESAAAAKSRLADLVRSTLGPQVSRQTESELAWSALISALHRAEAVGIDAADLLADLTDPRELRVASSISEFLAIQVSHYLAAHPITEKKAASREPPLPWMTAQDSAQAERTEIGRYLDDAASLITTCVAELADTAIRHRPLGCKPSAAHPTTPSMSVSGKATSPSSPPTASSSRSPPATPHQVLGPYVESGHAGHKAYWQAAESVLAARRLSGMDPATGTATPGARARVQVATDIYRALPDHERAAISRQMASRLGDTWFGDHIAPDEDTATQPAHAAILTSTLIEHGHMTTIAPPTSVPAVIEEPPGAGFARRGPEARQTANRTPRQPGPHAAPRHESVPRHDSVAPRGPQPRIG